MDGSDMNVSITYETGGSDLYPHFNVFVKWEGMEVYSARMSSIMAMCLSVNMVANDIVVLFVDNERRLKVYMEKEGLEQVGDWFEEPNRSMNSNDVVEGSIDLGINRKRKRTSVQHMQSMLLPKVRDESVCMKAHMDSFFYNMTEMFVEYVNNHQKMVSYLHISQECARRQ